MSSDEMEIVHTLSTFPITWKESDEANEISSSEKPDGRKEGGGRARGEIEPRLILYYDTLLQLAFLSNTITRRINCKANIWLTVWRVKSTV